MQAETGGSGPAGCEPLFVVGADRSGTTLLRLMLNSHTEVAIPPESHFLAPLLKVLPAQVPLSPEQVRCAIGVICECPRFSMWSTTPADLKQALKQYRNPTLGVLVDTAFRLEILPSGKKRWGDKTPGYAVIIDQISELFPHARFIHIIRDGRDVSLSLKKVAWSGWTEYERARYWARVVEKAEASGGRLGASRFLRIRYEDLVLEPRPVLERVSDFLGIQYQEGMLSFHESALENITEPEIEAGIHRKLTRSPRSTDVGRWRREASIFRVLLFEGVAGRIMDRLGDPRHFGGRYRSLTAIARLVYTPFGICVSLVHRFFDQLPESTRSSLRLNRLLRWMKRPITRW